MPISRKLRNVKNLALAAAVQLVRSTKNYGNASLPQSTYFHSPNYSASPLHHIKNQHIEEKEEHLSLNEHKRHGISRRY